MKMMTSPRTPRRSSRKVRDGYPHPRSPDKPQTTVTPTTRAAPLLQSWRCVSTRLKAGETTTSRAGWNSYDEAQNGG